MHSASDISVRGRMHRDIEVHNTAPMMCEDHHTDVTPEKAREIQAVRIFGKDKSTSTGCKGCGVHQSDAYHCCLYMLRPDPSSPFICN